MAITPQGASAVWQPFGGPVFPDASATIGLEEGAATLSTYPLSSAKAVAPSILGSSAALLGAALDVPQTVSPSVLTSSMTLLNGQVDSNVDVSPSILTSTWVIQTATLHIDQTVTVGSILASPATFFNPALDVPQDVNPTILSSAAVPLSPTVTFFRLGPSVLASSAQLLTGLQVIRGYPSFTLSDVRSTMPVKIKDNTYVVDWGKFVRQNAQSFRTSVDEGGDPFERSTSDERYWKRTQYNFELGAGQDYWDRRDSDRSRFRASLGVNPFTEGELSLYGGANSLAETGITDMVTARSGGTDYLYCLKSTAVRRLPSVGGAFSSVTGLSASGLASITTDGNVVWVSDGTQIESFTGTGGATQYSTFNAHLVGYANGRLLATDTAAKGAIYEISDSGATSTLIWTHPNANFQWKKIVPAPNGIYLVGEAGDRSEVYKITVADSTGDLVPPFPALEMEDGETIYDMVHYGGLFLASTSRGFRLFTIADATGHLTYGKAIDLENENGGQGLAARGEDVYVGWGGQQFTNAAGATTTASGVAHVRLTEFVEVLTPLYASGPSYRSGATSDDVEAVAYYGGAIFWTVNGALYNDQANPAVGTLEVGYLEYGTIDEAKRIVAAEVQHAALAAGTSVALDIIDTAGANTTAVSSSTTSATSARTLLADESDERWRVFLTLTPSGANGPTVYRWTIEAIPVPSHHAEDVLFPLILKDSVNDDVTEAEVTYDVWTEYQYLKGLAESREIITVLIGDQTLKGYVYDVALPQQGEVYDWDHDASFLQGTYSIYFRTVEQ